MHIHRVIHEANYIYWLERIVCTHIGQRESFITGLWPDTACAKPKFEESNGN